MNKQVIVITSGPTRSYIDPIRYLSNTSSGRMGYALAQAAQQSGYEVILISGPCALTPLPNIKLIKVETTSEMLAAVMGNITGCNIFISAAAVMDYKSVSVSTTKIKKQHAPTLTLSLTKTPDILSAVSHQTIGRPFCVGFAAETNNLIINAQQKLKTKNLDMVIANLVGHHLNIGQDTNAVTIITPQQQLSLPPDNKINLARQIIKLIEKAVDRRCHHTE